MTYILALCLASPALAQDPPEEPAIGDSAEETPNDSDDTGKVLPEPEPEYKINFRGQATPDDPHFDLEELYAATQFKEGLDEANRQLQANPTDSALNWHLVRFMFENAETFDPKDKSIDRVAYYEEMLAVADAGLETTPGDPHIRFARGIAAGRLGTTRGVLSSLWAAKGIEQDWLYTANSGHVYSSIGGSEQLPCDAYHALGIFYRLVPDSWIVQMLAGTRGSLEKSHEFLIKADRDCPNRIQTMKELAATKMCMAGKKNQALMDEGKAVVEAYLKLEPADEKDEIDQKHGRLMLADPSMACGYSRDGQQDLDTKKLEG